MLSLAAILQKGQNPAGCTVCRSNSKQQDTMNGYSPAARQKRVTVIKRGAVLTDISHWANLKQKTQHECIITEVIHSRPLSQDPSDITHNAFTDITREYQGRGLTQELIFLVFHYAEVKVSRIKPEI